MPANLCPIPPGTKSSDASLAADLGNVYWEDDAAWRLVKATAALTSIASHVMKDTSTSGALAYNTSSGATAASDRILGVAHASQVDLASGDYFMVQVAGQCKAHSGGSTAGLAQVAANGGKLVDFTGADAAAIVAAVGNIIACSLETATDNQDKQVRLVNLL